MEGNEIVEKMCKWLWNFQSGIFRGWLLWSHFTCFDSGIFGVDEVNQNEISHVDVKEC